jgi:hypothetical protein
MRADVNLNKKVRQSFLKVLIAEKYAFFEALSFVMTLLDGD